MQKSASAGALHASGIQQLSHIPKRAVQHSTHLPAWEVPPTDLKPGQTTTTRQVYAEEAKPLKDTYINPDRPQVSNYTDQLGNLLEPKDFLDPTKPIRQGEPTAGYGHHNVSHWRSTTHSFHNPDSISGAVYHRQYGPSYQASNPPSCIRALTGQSSYQEFHGKYGFNPRDLAPPGTVKMPVLKHALTRGTPKATNHIPGYQGFLPTNTANPYVARHESGSWPRDADKSSLTDQFHVNLLGYSGHVPLHPLNDRGGVMPNRESTFGRSFVAHKLDAFD
eukprot:CAMPEP_0206561308 /NCGR_PEP_ID=MMETSP0325_2-20121206/21534_1 /ASSEMBLY_ACC=CAM_ASM_000347 /TAXON_ID=2866 /ORGANISM="Crypthecodinium cohnii, Strain Seligo" /LENGTH=277 /DNA_ID=CAMNT_0054063219 /DNA_START=52 /DNA_END=885 /DNA_ORIENTATION=+